MRLRCVDRIRNNVDGQSPIRQRGNTKNNPQKLFIFGLGYTGKAVAKYFQEAHNWDVAGTCRSEKELEELRSSDVGVAASIYDTHEGVDVQEELPLTSASHILVTIPPNGACMGQDHGQVQDYRQGLDPKIIDSLIHASQIKSLQWVGYISSTSVYGDHNGAAVDEDSELRAFEGKGLARIEAEQAWSSLWQDHQVPVHIFRCGGIYGPDRNVIKALVQSNDQLKKSRDSRQLQQFTARIHVCDLSRVLYASAINPCPGAVYNAVDDDPASRLVVEDYARKLLQFKGIGVQRDALHATRAATGRGPLLPEKRVSNKRVKQELRIDLKYPTYRQGIDALINECNICQ
jgi:nucleoside-diphosphate-sugar epimerase